jgi:hypothetical protein
MTIDNLVAAPRSANDAVMSIAPTVAIGAGQIVTAAAVIATVVENAAIAAKYGAPGETV